MRFAVPFASVLALACSSLPVSGEDTPAKPKVKKTPNGIVISKETTFYTGPLDKEGYVDYLQVINQKASEGVTPQNNSAVLLVQALGPETLGESWREEYFQLLGVPVPPLKGDYLKSFEDIHPELPIEQRRARFDLLNDQMSEAMARPWSKEEFPLLAEWVRLNEVPLKHVTEGVKRSEHYSPYVSPADEEGPGMVIAILLPTIQEYRELARVLSVRAMYWLKLGETEKAMDDLLTLHRLGNTVQQGMTLIEALVGIAIESIAIQGDQLLIQHGKATPKQLQEYAAKLRQIPQPHTVNEIIAFGERIMFLDSVQYLSREKGGIMRQLQLMQQLSFLQPKEENPLDAMVMKIGLDYGLMMKIGNGWYDRLADAGKHPTRQERMKAFQAIHDDLKEMAGELQGGPAKVLNSVLKKSLLQGSVKRAISEQVGQILVSLLLPAVQAVFEAEDRIAMQSELNQVSFALAIYKAEQGSYPKALAELQPKYLKELPIDVYSGKPVAYRTTENGYVLYSVYRNEKDDNGVQELSPHEGDLVLPMPPLKQD